ncbi:MBL fold metallo-hydrolase [Spartinivicinus ruber]|uniref:MBL fold metallo-hydrolase n=1 Tax=Spartinivicinus ruber TaxID=2683272 RepID=UPI0013D41E42|nr:MBL fold metallo-hydrolase [Spartinivicinus ruber]
MKRINKKKVLVSVFALSLVGSTTAAEFIYKPASPIEIASDLQKIEGGQLDRYHKPFEIQRLSENVYWVSVSYYNVTVIVGQNSVLLIDAPMWGGKRVLDAIKTITDKPLSAIVYSHSHADHVGGVGEIIEELGNRVIDLYATEEVRNSFIAHKMNMPEPTKIISNRINFEGHDIKVNKTLIGHASDNTIFLIKDGNRKILHAVDIVHPDQLEFRNFSLAEDPILYQNDIDTLLSMDWDVMVTGHSNLGYKEDVKFLQGYISDIRKYLHEGFKTTNLHDHLKSDVPFEWYDSYSREVIDYAYRLLSKKYRLGREKEFDINARTHIDVYLWEMISRGLTP